MDMREINKGVIAEFRANDGALAGPMAGAPILLLTTRGRNSGKRHTTPVGFIEADGRLAVAAANGGSDRHPDWFHTSNTTTWSPSRCPVPRSNRSPRSLKVATENGFSPRWPNRCPECPSTSQQQPERSPSFSSPKRPDSPAFAGGIPRATASDCSEPGLE